MRTLSTLAALFLTLGLAQAYDTYGCKAKAAGSATAATCADGKDCAAYPVGSATAADKKAEKAHTAHKEYGHKL